MTGKNDGRKQGRTIAFFMGKNIRRRNPSSSGIRRTAGRDCAGIYRWKMRAGTGRLLLFEKKASRK